MSTESKEGKAPSLPDQARKLPLEQIEAEALAPVLTDPDDDEFCLLGRLEIVPESDRVVLQAAVDQWSDRVEHQGMDEYEASELFLAEIRAIGYDCDYGLCGNPFGLHKPKS